MKVMVTVTVQRDAGWEPDRTLTLSTGPGVEGDVGITAWWLDEFPNLLHRALGKMPEAQVDEPDVEPDDTPMSLWS